MHGIVAEIFGVMWEKLMSKGNGQGELRSILKKNNQQLNFNVKKVMRQPLQ